MEQTFSQIVLTEGAKSGLTDALAVLTQFRRHEMLEPGVEVDMPNVETILEEIYDQNI